VGARARGGGGGGGGRRVHTPRDTWHGLVEAAAVTTSAWSLAVDSSHRCGGMGGEKEYECSFHVDVPMSRRLPVGLWGGWGVGMGLGVREGHKH
jgi:hypothetical protein